MQRWSGILGAILAVGLISSVGMAASPSQVDYRFGVVESVANPGAARALGVGWSRVPLFWNALEPSPGQFNSHYTNQDQEYLNLAASGESLVGVVEGAPAWAESRRVPNLMTPPKGLDLPWNNPQNTWGQFMYWLARHYTGLINTWIIGNEISIHQGMYETWDGTVPQFARLLAVAYQAVHAANPAGRVLAPGEPYWYGHGRTTRELLNALAQLPGARTHHDYLDGLNLHLYNTIQYNPQIYSYYEGLLRVHGLATLPIWLTEANVAPANPRLTTGASPAEQASFLVEDFASSFQWVTRVEAYKLQDGKPPGLFQYGLVEDNGTRRPVFSAYETFIRLMSGATWIRQTLCTLTRGATTPSTPAVVTWGAPGRLIQIVWDQGFHPATAVLAATTGTATVVTLFGHRTVIHARGGVFRIPLSPATYNPDHSFQATIGGPPVYVIQTVPMGADGTPTQWNFGTPSGFPAQATGMWTASTHLAWPPDPPTVQALTNPSGDQVVIRADGILHWMTAAGTGPGQLNTPVAAAVAPDGSVYVANLGNSDVVHLAPSGQVLGTFGGYGTTPGELLGADGIAVGPTGTVYVIDAGAQAVASYSATGRFLRAWGHWGSGPGLFNGPAALAVGPHGTVYVADSLNNRVEAFSPTGAFQGQVATPDPAALTVTGSGLLDVTDGLSGQTSTVAFPRTLTLLAAPADATAVATGPTGAYAVATASGSVDVYSRLGTRIGQWTIAPAYGNRKAPNLTALAWHGTTLYVLDGRYNRILSIDSTVPASEPAALAIPAGSLLGPEGMAVAPDGTIWVADTDHERVVAFSPAGTVKQVVKLHDGVWGVAVLPSGEVAATRYYSGAVVLITPGSAAVKNLGFTHGAGPRELWHPTTVIALPSGGLAIWDRGNARAVMTTSAGVPVAWLNEPAGASAFTVLLAGAVAWTTPKGLQPISP